MKDMYWTAARIKGGAMVIRDRHSNQVDALEKAAKILIENHVDEVLILKQILLVTLPEPEDEDDS